MKTCGGKERFPTGAVARRALNAIRKRGENLGTGKPHRVYPCPTCHGFHLTSSLSTDPPKSKHGHPLMIWLATCPCGGRLLPSGVMLRCTDCNTETDPRGNVDAGPDGTGEETS